MVYEYQMTVVIPTMSGRLKIFSIIFLHIICIFSLDSVILGLEASPLDCVLFVGTYTGGASEGIYIYRVDMNTGALRSAAPAIRAGNPSYLTVSQDSRYLYAVNEGKPGGGVSAFSIDVETGGLTFINQRSIQGSSPCFITMDPEGKWVLTANYSGGSISVLPVGNDGAIGSPTNLVQHKGKSIHPKRQTMPHPHAIVFAPNSSNVFAVDLGTDKIVSYAFDKIRGKLTENRGTSFRTRPGTGPRHMVFHPNGSFAFLISELNSTITSLHFDSRSGTFTEIQTVSALPAGFRGENKSADIHVSPSGRYLYGSNRGHDTIVIYKIDQSTGKLGIVDWASCGGKTPRNFAIDPSGKFLLVANKESNSIVSFLIDQSSGKISPTGHRTEVPNPACLKFMVIGKKNTKFPRIN
jgi:6-phosphogluconolactonase